MYRKMSICVTYINCSSNYRHANQSSYDTAEMMECIFPGKNMHYMFCPIRMSWSMLAAEKYTPFIPWFMSQFVNSTYTHTHTHTHIYVYFVCVCVCVSAHERVYTYAQRRLKVRHDVDRHTTDFSAFVFSNQITNYQTNQPTNSLEQSPSWEPNRSSASQEIPRISCNLKDHHRVHKIPSPGPILSQRNPLHASPSHFLKLHFNIIFGGLPILF